MRDERMAAECFPVGYFIREEMRRRGWDKNRLVAEMNKYHLRVTAASVDFLLASLPRPEVVLDQETAEDLGRAFNCSPDFFLNLDRQYRDWLRAKRTECVP